MPMNRRRAAHYRVLSATSKIGKLLKKIHPSNSSGPNIWRGLKSGNGKRSIGTSLLFRSRTARERGIKREINSIEFHRIQSNVAKISDTRLSDDDTIGSTTWWGWSVIFLSVMWSVVVGLWGWVWFWSVRWSVIADLREGVWSLVCEVECDCVIVGRWDGVWLLVCEVECDCWSVRWSVIVGVWGRVWLSLCDMESDCWYVR